MTIVKTRRLVRSLVLQSLSPLTKRYFMKYPPTGMPLHDMVTASMDPIRYTTLALAISRIQQDGIKGSFAEAGVHRGHTSKLIHKLAPERTLYLFDTFEGFPDQDLQTPDTRFKDTSIEVVKQTIGDLNNVVFRQGYFPETAKGLENETFAFVMLDLDLYKPMLAGMEFFYPRMAPGGYIFAHDYNSPESDWAVSKALTKFLADKPEGIVDIPDRSGSVLIRKLRAP